MRLARISRGHDPRFLWQVGRHRARRRGAVRPLLRAGRAGAPRDAVARLDRRHAAAGRRASTRRQWVAGPGPRRRSPALLAVDRVGAHMTVRTRARSRHPADGPAHRPAAVAAGHRARVRLPGRPPGPLRGRPARSSRGERVALLGPNGAGKTTLVLHLNGILAAGARHGRGRRAAGGAGEPAGDPPPGRDRLPGPRRPAVHADGRARTWRSARRTSVSPAPRCARGSTPRSPPSAWPSTATAPRCTCPAGSAGGWRWPPCSPASRRSSCSTSRRPTSTRWPAASSPRCCSGWTPRMLMVTHDLPYALQLCPRSVVLDDGVVVADGPTARAARRPRAAAPPPPRAALRLHPALTARHPDGAAGTRRARSASGRRRISGRHLPGTRAAGSAGALLRQARAAPAAAGCCGPAARAGVAGRRACSAASGRRPAAARPCGPAASASATTLATPGPPRCRTSRSIDSSSSSGRCTGRRRPARARTGTPRPPPARPASG